MGNRDLFERLPQLVRGAAVFLIGATVFALAYTQAPLYYSNQNQYFLHGLADGGRGLLRDDWLAGTADPTPAFSSGVAITYRHLPEALFYIDYALLLGLYLLGMTGIFQAVAGQQASTAARCSFIVLLVLMHSAVLRWLSWRVLGNDYPWYFQCGLANQYLLGPVLQPSAFGVFLVVSVACFSNGRPYLAAVCAAAAAAIHTTYMPGAAMLTVAYMVVMLRERAGRSALLVGLLALAVVLPTLLYSWQTFGPSSAETFTQAHDVLVHFRVPHHADPRRWLDAIALAQIAWIGLGLWLARGTRLGAALLLVAVLTLTLSLAQAATGSDLLALLFPWRATAYLVPMATAIVLTRLVQMLIPRFEASAGMRQALVIGSAALMVALAATGIWLLSSGEAYRQPADELPVMEYVRTNKRDGDIYLVPIVLPVAPPAPRSPTPSDFKPADASRPAHQFDLQRFRLYTGAPLYVDFKAIPYKDVDVLEWRDRVLWARNLYSHLGDQSLGGLHEALRQRGITHVVARSGHEVRCRELTKIYEEGGYALYRVTEISGRRNDNAGSP